MITPETKYKLYTTGIIFCMLNTFIACQQPKEHIDKAHSTLQSINNTGIDNPTVDIKISVEDSVLSAGQEIMLNIQLTNNEKETQKIIFDAPSSSTFGPWATSAKVINVATGESMLEINNRRLLESNIYTKEELQDYYRILEPGQSLHYQYNLQKIVVFNTPDYTLPAGNYSVQLFYFGIPSNILTLEIK